jgi:hypothetical protein
MGRVDIARRWPGVIAAGFLLAFGLSACVTGGQAFPEASPGFAPKETYSVGTEKAWSAVVGALNANIIPIVSESKSTGQITTDYIAGPSQFVVVSSDNIDRGARNDL